MNMQNLLNQITGSGNNASATTASQPQSALSGFADKIPGGLMGGAAAGGIMALLVGNKSARKFAGKAATYGGAAVLGGLALKAFQNYKSNSSAGATAVAPNPGAVNPQDLNQLTHGETLPVSFELSLIKAMIAAAKSDGHMDHIEQKKIFDAISSSGLSSEEKSIVFDCFQRDIPMHELIPEQGSLEMSSEIYLASYLVIEPDQVQERYHLSQLAQALGLPDNLVTQLENEARQAIETS